MTLYDFSYIDNQIIGNIRKNLPNVGEILRTLERRATGKASTVEPSSDAGIDIINDDD